MFKQIESYDWLIHDLYGQEHNLSQVFTNLPSYQEAMVVKSSVQSLVSQLGLEAMLRKNTWELNPKNINWVCVESVVLYSIKGKK